MIYKKGVFLMLVLSLIFSPYMVAMEPCSEFGGERCFPWENCSPEEPGIECKTLHHWDLHSGECGYFECTTVSGGYGSSNCNCVG